jgi:hypothetical protein
VKPMTRTQVVNLWTEHVRKVLNLQNTAMLLMQHPDATPEQLMEAHFALVKIMQAHRDAVPRVRAVWPRWLPFPNIEEKIMP